MRKGKVRWNIKLLFNYSLIPSFLHIMCNAHVFQALSWGPGIRGEWAKRTGRREPSPTPAELRPPWMPHLGAICGTVRDRRKWASWPAGLSWSVAPEAGGSVQVMLVSFAVKFWCCMAPLRVRAVFLFLLLLFLCGMDSTGGPWTPQGKCGQNPMCL